MFHRQAGFILAMGMPIALAMLGSAWLDRLTQTDTHIHSHMLGQFIITIWLAWMSTNCGRRIVYTDITYTQGEEKTYSNSNKKAPILHIYIYIFYNNDVKIKDLYIVMSALFLFSFNLLFLLMCQWRHVGTHVLYFVHSNNRESCFDITHHHETQC